MKLLKKQYLLILISVVLIRGATAQPVVSNVKLSQRAGSRLVDITYDLLEDAAIITVGIETNGVALPEEEVTRLSGDISTLVQPGQGHRIVWDACTDLPDIRAGRARARVTAWFEHAPPLYMVVDLSAGYEADVNAVRYYTSEKALPHGGLTNVLYRTDRVVLRRVSAGTFAMGSVFNEPERDALNEKRHKVTLTTDFYLGVFEVTQKQWFAVTGNWPSYFMNTDWRDTRPVESVSYTMIRGAQAGSGWPTNNAVDSDSFMGMLRAKSGLSGFDLPTDAQWEYACRAGTQSSLNDGTDIANLEADPHLDLLGRYRCNGGKLWIGNAWVDPESTCSPLNGTALVGQYAPNAWGFYDMHGNVWEWCLDWYSDDLGCDAVVDPIGPAMSAGGTRVWRSAGWSRNAGDCRSAFRGTGVPALVNSSTGLRVALNLK